nr:MAG TPA: hypothetical protein [Caudoviricetes sp.]
MVILSQIAIRPTTIATIWDRIVTHVNTSSTLSPPFFLVL